jgi:sugar phosphate isomerase/epimerase
MTITLGCSELCLSGRPEEKLELLEEIGLWLELANTGPRNLSFLDTFDVEVKTVQAYKLHELHWLSHEDRMREVAYEHVLDTIRVAEDVGAEYILTVPTYGFDLHGNSRELCIENYRKLSKETHLGILIEALSSKQTSFMPSLSSVAELVNEIGRDNVGLAADTWHIQESGVDVVETIRSLGGEIMELHLRDTDSRPPGRGSMDFRGILDACSAHLFCLEYKAGSKQDLREAGSHIRSLALDI